jgi:hypothetical protein
MASTIWYDGLNPGFQVGQIHGDITAQLREWGDMTLIRSDIINNLGDTELKGFCSYRTMVCDAQLLSSFTLTSLTKRSRRER